MKQKIIGSPVVGWAVALALLPYVWAVGLVGIVIDLIENPD